MATEKRNQINLRLPSDLLADALRLAAKRGQTPPDFFRAAIAGVVHEHTALEAVREALTSGLSEQQAALAAALDDVQQLVLAGRDSNRQLITDFLNALALEPSLPSEPAPAPSPTDPQGPPPKPIY